MGEGRERPRGSQGQEHSRTLLEHLTFTMWEHNLLAPGGEQSKLEGGTVGVGVPGVREEAVVDSVHPQPLLDTLGAGRQHSAATGDAGHE